MTRETDPILKIGSISGREFDLRHFGTITMNILRMEKGFKMWGSEMNLDVNAFEAGLQKFIHWQKVF